MGKKSRKQRSSVSINNDEYPVDAVVGEYQVPVMQIHELMALKPSKLDDLSLRAISVNNIFQCISLAGKQSTGVKICSIHLVLFAG